LQIVAAASAAERLLLAAGTLPSLHLLSCFAFKRCVCCLPLADRGALLIDASGVERARIRFDSLPGTLGALLCVEGIVISVVGVRRTTTQARPICIAM
jgi:hypothetical protein